MANRFQNKKGYRLRFNKSADFNIPAENILDLKKIINEKKTADQERKEKKLNFKIGTKFFRLFKKSPHDKKETSFLLPERPAIFSSSKNKVLVNPLINFPEGGVKTLMAFFLVASILILPIYSLASYQEMDDIKGKVLGITSEAYDHLKAASKAFTELNFKAASSEFNTAFDYFTKAQEILQTVSGFLKMIPVAGGEVSSAERLLKAGEAISTSGQYVAKAFAPLMVLTQEDKVDNPFNFPTALLLANTNLKPAVSELNRAELYLQKIPLSSIPNQYQEQLALVKQNLPQINAVLKEALDLSDLLLQILGYNTNRRYLLIFQNNAELRPTGGFIGSFALMTLEKGAMKELEIPGGGPYDLNGWLRERVIAPKPLHLVNPHWYLQDANWFPDFPISAKKIIWFFNESGGPSVDGVIALTPDVIESLLELTGPIDLTEKYSEIITKDNFRIILQKETEKKYDETKESKKIIAELTPLVFNKIAAMDQLKQLQALGRLNNLLREKFLLFYFNDPELENTILSRGWAGEIKEVPLDYLSIINTNISGGKTDLMIDELIDYKLNIQENGKARAMVTVTRTHKGQEGESFVGIKNIDFMRFYVPKGSRLVEAGGFETIDPRKFLYPDKGYEEDKDLKEIEGKVVIDESSGMRINEEFNKTVFGNWVGTEPGKSSQVSITYDLPFKIKLQGLFSKSDSYSLLVQKQPGTKNSVLNAEITFPENYQILWQYPEDNSLEISSGQADFTDSLSQDRYLGFVLLK